METNQRVLFLLYYKENRVVLEVKLARMRDKRGDIPSVRAGNTNTLVRRLHASCIRSERCIVLEAAGMHRVQ